MTVSYQYFPFDSGPGSNVEGDRWREMFSWMRSNGIVTTDLTLNTSTSDLAVTPGTGLHVQVAQGDAIINGTFFIQTGNYTILPIQPNSSGNPRIDLICLQLDTVNNIIDYIVLEGTPAGSPVPPTPTQTSILWQMPLYRLAVANGASSFITANLTDEREKSFQDTSAVTLTSDGGDDSLVTGAIGPNLAIKGLTAGSNITLTPGIDDITITSNVSGSGVTLASAGADMGTTSLVNTGMGPDLKTVGLVAGTGISFSTDATDITISQGSSIACKVFNSMSSTVTSMNSANLFWDTNLYDPTGMHSTMMNTDRIQIATTGLYAISLSTFINFAGAAGLIVFQVFRNSGSNVAIGQVVDTISAGGSLFSADVTLVDSFTAGDFIFVTCANHGSTTITINSAASYSPTLSVTYVGALS